MCPRCRFIELLGSNCDIAIYNSDRLLSRNRANEREAGAPTKSVDTNSINQLDCINMTWLCVRAEYWQWIRWAPTLAAADHNFLKRHKMEWAHHLSPSLEFGHTATSLIVSRWLSGNSQNVSASQKNSANLAVAAVVARRCLDWWWLFGAGYRCRFA